MHFPQDIWNSPSIVPFNCPLKEAGSEFSVAIINFYGDHLSLSSFLCWGVIMGPFRGFYFSHKQLCLSNGDGQHDLAIGGDDGVNKNINNCLQDL